MGIHTTIYRERDLRPDNLKKYSIKLFMGDKEVKLENPVLIREEFYFGKSVWAINEWFYQREIKECKRWGFKPGKDLSYECMFDQIIYLDDLKELLKDVNRALEDPDRVKEIMPMPKKLKSCPYDEYYFESLRWAKELLEQLISEDEKNRTNLYFDYILDIG